MKRLFFVCLLLSALSAFAQTTSAKSARAARKAATTTATATAAKPKPAASTRVNEDEVKALRDELAAQRRLLEQMQQSMQQRDAALAELRQSLNAAQSSAQTAQSSAQTAQSQAASAETAAKSQSAVIDDVKSQLADVKLNQQNAAVSTQDDQKRLVAAESFINRFRLSGDIRVRGESFFQDATPDRWRARIRIRLGIDGKLSEDFIGGVYLASGSNVNGTGGFLDPVSTNQTLTDFFERKTIGIDRGFITWNPVAHNWLSITGGKWAYSWQRTPLTFDSDLNPEGFNEKISKDLKNKFVRNVSAQAIELLYNEISGVGADSNALGGSFSSKLQFGKRVTMTPSYTALNFNNADAIAQAASPVTLPQPNTPTVGTPLPQPTSQPVRLINANAFTNASAIAGTGTGQHRVFTSGFLYSNFIDDIVITTKSARFPVHFIVDYEKNLRARVAGDTAYWIEGSIGQARNRNDVLFGYSFARVEQDAVISQFNESDMRAPTNVLQHRFYGNWVIRPNMTAGVTLWVGHTLDTALQNALRAPGVPVGGTDPWLKRLQLDMVYKF